MWSQASFSGLRYVADLAAAPTSLASPLALAAAAALAAALPVAAASVGVAGPAAWWAAMASEETADLWCPPALA